MANPNAVAEGSGLKLDLVTNGAGEVGLKRGYDAGTPTGATSPAKAQATAPMPSAMVAVDTDAAAALQASLPAVASKRNYLTGFTITGGGATSAGLIRATITGIGVTWGIDIAIPAGVTGAITPIVVMLPNPIPASADNTAIVLDVPSFGSGNTVASCAIFGYVSA